MESHGQCALYFISVGSEMTLESQLKTDFKNTILFLQIVCLLIAMICRTASNDANEREKNPLVQYVFVCLQQYTNGGLQLFHWDW